LFQFTPPAGTGQIAVAFLTGIVRDLLVGAWLTIPIFALLALIPASTRARWPHRLFWSACVLFWFGQFFLLFVEYFFFEEFRSRFNTVAVDYLQYPTEVFVNIWDSYHVGIVLLVCLLLALAWTCAASRFFLGPFEVRASNARSVRVLAALVMLVTALTPLAMIAGSLAGVMNSSLHLPPVRLSDERSLNEIANNGELAFFTAALTHHLDYAQFYRTLPREQAYQRARDRLAAPGVHFVSRPDSLSRQVSGDSSRPRLNVVILLEESFGSEFWGCLGRTNSLTPEMDKLAEEEGILFTNLYASGNRTVRGMEGVLASFPPLPGESIVKREFSDNVETIARLLKRDGYSTLFLYGGRGVFDGMRSFAVRNGYDRFIEQKQFEHPTFTTVWGVCDEDLFMRSVEECKKLSQLGQPFFATVLSVSNHKPFTYPDGKIAENPNERRRENAVKYSDFALGQFFRAAKKESFWTNTIFAVVADHGARVYGEQTIPIHSYEIPLLIVGPALAKGPSRIGRLGCSLDVAPTILGLIGRPYQSTFFGKDLLNATPEQGRALLNHNRDIGLLSGDRLVVLGLMRAEEFYVGDPKLGEMKVLAEPETLDRELENDAAAIYQVADDLYTHQRYRIERLEAGQAAIKSEISNISNLRSRNQVEH
jgi:phosphoglycerol transferase MdoB-like AlkP superfamily enzyme